MNKTMILAILAAVTMPFAAVAAPEGRCDSEGTPALGIVQIDTPAGTYYIDDRNYILGNGIWLYEETNTVDGLQRGGASDVIPDDAEICTDTGDWDPDRLIF